MLLVSREEKQESIFDLDLSLREQGMRDQLLVTGSTEEAVVGWKRQIEFRPLDARCHVIEHAKRAVELDCCIDSPGTISGN